jgi:galactokinase
VTDPGGASETLERVRKEFHALYSHPPTHLVQAPGRVNLIGEHIDYCGLSVLPMAIQRRVQMLVHPRDDAEVRVASSAYSYELRTFELAEAIPRYAGGDWGNYVKAAAQAMVRRLASGAGGHPSGAPLRGFDGLIYADLQPAAGLSSSSAVVIASGLGLLAANGLKVPPLAREGSGPDASQRAVTRAQLAGHLAHGERYVGTAGGGMDQAVCLLARAGTALRIDFDPLHTKPIPIPEDWKFVVAHSFVAAEKSKSALAVYNQRTRESREAGETVWDALSTSGGSGGYPDLLVEHVPHELLIDAEDTLHPTLRRRFRHVVTEAQRVNWAEAALEAHDLNRFGEILTASHLSLRDDYEVSAVELDELVKIMEEAGAAGARLTGAGMGGCAIGVCTSAKVEAVCEALRAKFYGRRFPPGEVVEYPFVALPSDGASVTRL